MVRSWAIVNRGQKEVAGRDSILERRRRSSARIVAWSKASGEVGGEGIDGVPVPGGAPRAGGEKEGAKSSDRENGAAGVQGLVVCMAAARGNLGEVAHENEPRLCLVVTGINTHLI